VLEAGCATATRAGDTSSNAKGRDDNSRVSERIAAACATLPVAVQPVHRWCADPTVTLRGYVMAKSGNTWFKIKRNKGRKVGFLHSKVVAPASPTMNIIELARTGEIKRKAVKAREVCRPVGFVMSGRGAAESEAPRDVFREAWYLLGEAHG
jgi:hypothetical protein